MKQPAFPGCGEGKEVMELGKEGKNMKKCVPCYQSCQAIFLISFC